MLLSFSNLQSGAAFLLNYFLTKLPLLGTEAMPYVRRKNGKITHMFHYAQPDYAEEFLNDSDPEVLALREPPPIPPEMLKPPSNEDVEKLNQDQKRIENEHEELRNRILSFNHCFSELEVALSALFYVVLNSEPRSSHIPYAAYYSPDGFHGRIILVRNVVRQLILENPGLSSLEELCEGLFSDFNGVRNMRNNIAHGTPITMVIRGKKHVRLTAPSFDVNRVGRPLKLTGDPPGLKAADVFSGVKKVRWLSERIDDLNRVVEAFYQNQSDLFTLRLSEFRDNLQKTNV